MSNDTFTFIFDLDKLMNRMYHYKDLPNFGLALERGLEKGLDQVSTEMVDKLLENLAMFGLQDSGLITSIDIDFLEEGVSLIIDDGASGYAMFVEYGTGVVGADNPHPNPARSGWVYDINSHGEEGWWYQTVEGDPNPTKYITSTGEWLAWTKGMPSRPFMYMTWLWTTRRATQIIDMHIKKELRELERRMK